MVRNLMRAVTIFAQYTAALAGGVALGFAPGLVGAKDDSSCNTCDKGAFSGGPWTITWCEDKTEPDWCSYPLKPNFGYRYEKKEYNCSFGGGAKCYKCYNEHQEGCCNWLEERPICCTDGRYLCEEC